MTLAAARHDLKRFITAGGFQADLTLTPPVPFTVGLETITSVQIKGLAAKHWTSLSSDGLPINSKNARVTIIESDLVALSYPVRDARGEVNLKDHFVDYIDNTGILENMRVKEWYPDETLGSITLILNDYKKTA